MKAFIQMKGSSGIRLGRKEPDTMKLRDLAIPEMKINIINTSQAIYGENRRVRARSGLKKVDKGCIPAQVCKQNGGKGGQTNFLICLLVRNQFEVFCLPVVGNLSDTL